MINVKIYGKQSSTFEYMKMMLAHTAKKCGVKLNLTEESDIDVFIQEQLDHIPTVKINDVLIKNNHQDINEYISTVNLELIKKSKQNHVTHYLVPIDFSEASENAIIYAQKLSNKTSGLIHLLYVHRPRQNQIQELGYDHTESLYRKKLKIFENKINKQNISLPPNKIIVDSIFETGFAAEQILIQSQKFENCVTIIGSRGSSNNTKQIFGSVSTKVANFSKSPVIIVPPNSDFAIPHKVAFCSESSKLNSCAIAQLTTFVKTFDAELHLIYLGKKTINNKEKTENLFSKFYQKDKLITTNIEDKEQVEAINTFCQNQNINMLSICRETQGIFNRLLGANFTKKIAINTSIPLLILNK